MCFVWALCSWLERRSLSPFLSRFSRTSIDSLLFPFACVFLSSFWLFDLFGYSFSMCAFFPSPANRSSVCPLKKQANKTRLLRGTRSLTSLIQNRKPAAPSFPTRPFSCRLQTYIHTRPLFGSLSFFAIFEGVGVVRVIADMA